MIVIKHCEKSNYYADYCIPSWSDYGFRVNKFDAETPESIKEKENLSFAQINHSSKYFSHNLKVAITETEKACWYSHFMLWKMCIELNDPIMILEHDAYFYKPENFWMDLIAYDLIFYDKAAMGSYVITPSAANSLVDYYSKNRITTGVFAGVHNCYINKKFKKLVHAHFTTKIEPCVNQVYSRKYKNTIHHPSEDYPNIKWRQHEFIYID